MELSEIRKGVIAVLGAVVAVVPQVLSSLAGVIPANVASYLTIVASVATAALVYLVPNSTPVQKVQATFEALRPAFDEFKREIRQDVDVRLRVPSIEETFRRERDRLEKEAKSFVSGRSGGGSGAVAEVSHVEPPEGPFTVRGLGR